MSDCLHCDIHEILESHLQGEQADLAEIAARVTEVHCSSGGAIKIKSPSILMADVVGKPRRDGA